MFFCLLMPNGIRGQNSLYFNKYYNIGFSKCASPMLVPLEDSTYAVLAYGYDSISGQQNMGILKIDKYGSLVIKKNYDLGNNYLYYNNGFRYFLNANKSSLFVTSGAYIGSQLNACLTKINKQTLDTIRTSYYGDAFFHYYLSSSIKINPNKYLFIGTKYDTNNLWPFILETDSNMIANNTITCINTHSFQPISSLINPIDKKIIMSGNKNEGLNFYGFIAKYDTLGNFIDSTVFRGFKNGVAKIIYSAVDNSYVTLGGKVTSMYGGNSLIRIFICKYDANLNLIWSKTIGKSNITSGCYNGVINPDGSILAVGKYSDSLANPVINKNYNGIMLKLSINGDSLWMKQFDSLNDNVSTTNNWLEGFYGIEKTFDGGYIVCGDIAGKPKSEAWVVKTDSSGCDLSACMFSGIEEKNLMKDFVFNIYPNPNSGKFTVELNNFKNINDYWISLIDIYGREILKIKPTSNKTSIENISSGIYIVKLTQNESLIKNIKIVITN